MSAGVFSEIYRRNLWRGDVRESLSGPGSCDAATQHVAPAIAELVEARGFTSVLDMACGDGYWMPDLPGYVGIDVAPEAINRARQLHPDRVYVLQDALTLDSLTGFDLVILRDVVQHLTLEDGLALVASARISGGYLLASTYEGGENIGCPPARALTGWAYDVDMTAAPFSLGEPEALISDGYAYAGDAIRDERKYLGLWAS